MSQHARENPEDFENGKWYGETPAASNQGQQNLTRILDMARTITENNRKAAIKSGDIATALRLANNFASTEARLARLSHVAAPKSAREGADSSKPRGGHSP